MYSKACHQLTPDERTPSVQGMLSQSSVREPIIRDTCHTRTHSLEY